MEQLIKGSNYQKYEKFIPAVFVTYGLHVFLLLISGYGFYAVLNTHTQLFSIEKWQIILPAAFIAALIQYFIYKYKESIIEFIVILWKKEERQKLDIWDIALRICAIVVTGFCIWLEVSVSFDGINEAEIQVKTFSQQKHTSAKSSNLGEGIENKAQAQYEREMQNIEKLYAAKEEAAESEYRNKAEAAKDKASKAGAAKQWASSLLAGAKNAQSKGEQEVLKIKEERAQKEAEALSDLKASQKKSEAINASNIESVSQLEKQEGAKVSGFSIFFKWFIAGLYALLIFLTFIVVLVYKKTNTEVIKVERHTAAHSLKDMFYSCESVIITFLQFCNRLILKLSNLKEPEARDLILHDQKYNLLGANDGAQKIAAAKKIGFESSSEIENVLTIISANEMALKWLQQNKDVNEIRLKKANKGIKGTRKETAENNMIAYQAKIDKIKEVNNGIKAQIFPTLF